VGVRVDQLVALAIARVGVGVGFTVAPEVALPRSEATNGTALFLMRTIGIRDLVLGGGAVCALLAGSEAEFRRWASFGLVSDVLDGAASMASTRMIGRRSAAIAFGVVAPWIAIGSIGVARRRVRRGYDRSSHGEDFMSSAVLPIG
jgi:hypothetical protein